MVLQYQHLKGMVIEDTDINEQLLVHLILGTNVYAQVKMETMPKIGKPREHIAELMHSGWRIMSPGSKPTLTNMFLTQTSAVDYEAL